MRTLVAVSALVSKNGSFLFIEQNKEGGAYPNTIHIPGGRLEIGETPLEGITREVREETGIDIKTVKPFDFDWDTINYKGIQTIFVFLRFTAEYASGDLMPSSDAEKVMWIPKKELKKQKHNPASLRLLEKLNLI